MNAGRLGLYTPLKSVAEAQGCSSTVQVAVAAAVGGAVGGAIGNPFQVIKVQLMSITHPTPTNNSPKLSPAAATASNSNNTVLVVARRIFETDGVAGFFRGTAIVEHTTH